MRVVKVFYFYDRVEYDIVLAKESTITEIILNNTNSLVVDMDIFNSPITQIGLADSKAEAYEKYAEYFI